MSTDGRHSLDAVFEALRDRRQRYALYHLQEAEICGIDELTDRIAAWEQAEGSGEQEKAENETLRTEINAALHHHHLPRLDESGLVEYDERTCTVRFREPPLVLERVLSIAADVERPNG